MECIILLHYFIVHYYYKAYHNTSNIINNGAGIDNRQHDCASCVNVKKYLISITKFVLRSFFIKFAL